MKYEKSASYGRGGRLTRTDVLTVRIDPRLNFLLDVVARTERRTKSSYAECALEAQVTQKLKELARERFRGDDPAAVADLLWHPEPWRRLQNLAEKLPHVMTVNDEDTLAFLNESYVFWRPDAAGRRELDALLLRDIWPMVEAAVAGQVTFAEVVEEATRIKGRT